MGAGRKPKWDELNMEERLDEVEKLARKGLRNKDIAAALGVDKTTFYKWKKEHPEFAIALEKGKGIADRKVENATYLAAMGYYKTEEQVTNKGTVVKVRKWYPPNPTLNIFWLKNRMPDKWRDKIVNEHEGKVNHEVVVEWSGPMMDDDDAESEG
jgi:transposase-like protein